jgi:hypothetical protein
VSNRSETVSLFDHLVGAGEHRLAAGSEASHLVRTFATTTASLFNLSSQLG